MCWQVGSSRCPGSRCRLLLYSNGGTGPLVQLTRAAGVFQIAKLRSELEMVSGNVRVMSEMLTELVPTQAEPADLELLQVSRQLAAPGFSWGKPGNPPASISPPAPLQFHSLWELRGHSARG